MTTRFDTCKTVNEVETANLTLETFKQGKEEDLRSYYNRTKGFLEEAGGQDFRETTPPQTFSTEIYYNKDLQHLGEDLVDVALEISRCV